MAVAALTALLTDILLENAGQPTGFGSSNSESSENVLQRQGNNCGSNGHDGTLGPTTPTNPNQYCGSYWSVSSQNLSTVHLHVWLRGMYPLRSKALGGLSIYVSDGTNTGLWYISGSDIGYSGDWLHGVVDCSKAFDVSSGSPNKAAITQIGGGYNISSTKGADILYPFFFDAIRKENGSGQNGIRIVGGTTGDRLLISDLPIGDETLRTGISEISRGNVFCGGEWHFGNAASTLYLQDDLVTVSFDDLPVASDYYKIIFNDGTTGITDFRVTKLTWKGVNRALPFNYDTSALGTGDAHNCPDETFVFGGTLTFGSQTTKLRPVFTECVTIVPNGIELTDAVFSNSDAITLTATNDKIMGGVTTLHNTLTGVAYVTTNSLSKVENSSFDNTAGVGHAIEITTAGTYSFSGNTFTGYGADASNDAAIYNNSGGAVTINIVGGGGTPTVRNGAGASTTVNNSVTVKVSGVTEGTPVTVISNETVGTITIGDVILSAFADSNGEATTTLAYEGAFDPSGLDVISSARNQGVAVAVIADDGGVFTDETTEASSNATADMTLLPATPALNDAYYFAHNEQFTQIKVDVSTVLTFSAQPTVLWEYWNGSAWTALSGISDGTNGYETLGENIISFTLPGNWATTTINAQGPLYYIRARLSAAGTITQTPVGRKASIDASRYLPYSENRVIVSGTGLSDIANWSKDTISTF